MPAGAQETDESRLESALRRPSPNNPSVERPPAGGGPRPAPHDRGSADFPSNTAPSTVPATTAPTRRGAPSASPSCASPRPITAMASTRPPAGLQERPRGQQPVRRRRRLALEPGRSLRLPLAVGTVPRPRNRPDAGSPPRRDLRRRGAAGRLVVRPLRYRRSGHPDEPFALPRSRRGAPAGQHHHRMDRRLQRLTAPTRSAPWLCAPSTAAGGSPPATGICCRSTTSAWPTPLRAAPTRRPSSWPANSGPTSRSG